jgi:hypothetical protein
MPIISSMFTTKLQADERKSICHTCSQYNSTVKICKSCGCFVPAKVWLRGVACPDGHWTAVEDDGELHHVDDAVWNSREG